MLQNNNFIETMKHINSYRVENIPGMDIELLTIISLLNLQGKKKKRLGLKIVISFSQKCVLPNPCEILGLYLLIYIYNTREQLSFGLMGLPKQERI